MQGHGHELESFCLATDNQWLKVQLQLLLDKHSIELAGIDFRVWRHLLSAWRAMLVINLYASGSSPPYIAFR